MLKIGEFAQLGNVSIRALRFYHEEGLLEPSYVDPFTNYRSYEPKQLQDLQDIRLYKAMKFSLAEMRDLVKERPRPTERRKILSEKRTFLKQRIANDVESLARIEAQLRGAEGRDARDCRPGWRRHARNEGQIH